MKALIPITLCALVGVCSIPFIYGFKKAFSQNPFIYAGCFNALSGIVLLAISYMHGGIEDHYLTRNALPIVLAASGIVLVNIIAYFVITRHGASYWMIASLSSMLIPAVVVGFIVFKEKYNLWIYPAVVCALLTVLFFALSKK